MARWNRRYHQLVAYQEYLDEAVKRAGWPEKVYCEVADEKINGRQDDSMFSPPNEDGIRFRVIANFDNKEHSLVVEYYYLYGRVEYKV